MRKSLALLATACQVGDDSFYEKVAASGWLKHVKMVRTYTSNEISCPAAKTQNAHIYDESLLFFYKTLLI